MHTKSLTAFSVSFVDELIKAGVVEAVVSPGSRSTPLAYALTEHPKMNVWVNIDERSAAFFALGIAKETRRPVVLLCTSGTAATNYFPAIAEARLSRVPLIVLTADRPHELRDVGAPQAIDQINLYGKHAKWFMEMPIPEAMNEVLRDEVLRFVRTTATRAVATAISAPAGVVHLNFPLREPLMLNFEEISQYVTDSEPITTVGSGLVSLSLAQARSVASFLGQYERGVIVCGQIDHPFLAQAVEKLASVAKFPILADPLSQLRTNTKSEYIIEGYDAFLRCDELIETLNPEVIIRIGAMPVSKPLQNFIKNAGAEHIVVDLTLGWRESTGTASYMITCDESMFCLQLSECIPHRMNENYFQIWKNVNRKTCQLLNEVNTSFEVHEGKLFSNLAKMLPEKCNVFVGNSMPIRDLDTFFHRTEKDIRIHANRGANGIDGVVSSALGVAAVSDCPSYLIIGDLSFLHDIGGLLAAKMNELSLTIIVINNDGGGIFSFLPQGEEPNQFEKLFGTPHGVTFEHITSLFGGEYRVAREWSEIEAAFIDYKKFAGLRILEIVSNRQQNFEEHRDLMEKISSIHDEFSYQT